MSTTLRSICLPLLGAACLLACGCGLGLEPTVTLVTDRPEMAAYVDRFNAVQSDVKVVISWQDSPSQAVLDGVTGDIVIGEWLSSPAVMDRMDGVGDLVKPGKLDPSWFYARLVAMGSRDNRPVLIPLSFSLPAMVFIPARLQSNPPTMLVSMDNLRTLGKLYNRTGKTGALVNVGFSPGWYPDFITDAALLLGARIRPGRNGLPAWDEAGMQKVVDLAHAWLTDTNGGVDGDLAFQARNFVQPWYKLLGSGKTLFALASFTNLFALSEEERRGFDFRWLSQDGAIPVCADVLFAGILRSSRDKKGARAFLQWFCTPSVQQTLLSVNQSRRIGVFGVTNGFSALKALNEKDLTMKYPLLLGHVPQENLLAFPEVLPDNWLKVRDELTAWVLDTARGSETGTLETRLEEWQAAQKK
jgi:ABC-type glycerol-3-phosphate transport system substrate-binding protein